MNKRWFGMAPGGRMALDRARNRQQSFFLRQRQARGREKRPNSLDSGSRLNYNNDAEQNGRNAFVMEYDEKFVDVIVDRWERFTGQKAVLLNGKDGTDGKQEGV